MKAVQYMSLIVAKLFYDYTQIHLFMCKYSIALIAQTFHRFNIKITTNCLLLMLMAEAYGAYK